MDFGDDTKNFSKHSEIAICPSISWKTGIFISSELKLKIVDNRQSTEPLK